MIGFDPVASILRFEEIPGVNDFCERNLSFSLLTSPNQPGQWSTLQRPYMREPLEDFHPESGCTDLDLCWGAQCAKTTVLIGGMAFRLEYVDGGCLWVLPDSNLAKSFAETRWMRFVDENDVLAAHKPANLDQYKIAEQQYQRGTYTFCGSHSASALSSRPKRTVVNDEVAKFRPATEHEASASSLSDQRTKAFGESGFRVKTSTPTTPGHEFSIRYEEGDQRHFLVECPHCKEPIRLHHVPLDETKNLKQISIDPENSTLGWDPNAKTPDGLWDKTKIEASAFFRCHRCGEPIRDGQKPSILLSGQWVASNPQANRRHHSYHLGSLYSPDVAFGVQLVEFLKGKESLTLQDYLNGWEAKTYAETVMEVGDEDVRACRSNYAMGTIPADAAHLIDRIMIGVDPGQMCHYWAITGHNDATGDCWVLDAGTCLGFGDLTKIYRKKRFSVGEGGDEQRRIDGVGWIDSGDWTEDVYDYCYGSGGVFWPTKGSKTRVGTIASSKIKTHPGLTLLTYVDYTAKNDLYESRIKEKKGARLYLPENAPEELIKGLSGQEKLSKRTAEGDVYYWKKIAWDHFGDAIKINLRGHKCLLVGALM